MPTIAAAAAATPDPDRVSADLTRALPLRDSHLYAEAEAGLARLVLEQTFANPHGEALHVTYVLPLPHEAAVSGFAFAIGERTVEGEIDAKSRARERFEDAIASGHTAALLEEERSTVFTQELGNIPPRTQVTARITLDLPLKYLALAARGQWELRFPLTVAPRYLGERGRVPDAAQLTVEPREVSEETPRLGLALVVRDALPAGRSPESPSHALQCARGAGAEDPFSVGLGGEGTVPLDRDLVIRWDAATEATQARAAVHWDAAEDAAYALVTVVPPCASPEAAEHGRDLTVLLDTSGSMGGEPLAQAKRVAKALVTALRETDRVHLVEFSNDARAFGPAAALATPATKTAALAWIAALRASGGTEMRTGILRALRDVRPGRHTQVVLVTDGLIGFEQEIVSAIFRDNAQGARVHTVGVGSAVNRSLLAPAARAGRGLEIVCGVGEDTEPLVARLLARTTAPVVTELAVKRLVPAGELEVACALEKLPDLYAAAPVLVPVRLPREGGTLVISGRAAHGGFRQVLEIVVDGVARPHVRALYGREAALDVDMRLAAGAYASAREADAEIERLGLAFGISTRMTSFVAVDTARSVDPTRPARRETVAQALPFGMTAEGAGLRPASASMPVAGGAVSGKVRLRKEVDAFASAPPPPPRSPAPTGAPPAQGPAPAPAPRRPAGDLADGAGEKGAAREERKSKKAAPSLIERAVRAVFSVRDEKRDEQRDEQSDEQSDAPSSDAGEGGQGAAPRSSASTPVSSTSRRTRLELEGRIRTIRAARGGPEQDRRDTVVVEVTLAEELELTHGTCTLVLADGARVTLALDPARSTAPGTYGAGAVLRFVGALGGEPGAALAAGDARTFEVEGARLTLVIRLS